MVLPREPLIARASGEQERSGGTGEGGGRTLSDAGIEKKTP